MSTKKLPVYTIVDQLKEQLVSCSTLILQAPPGAGKSTVVPLELLDANWLGERKIILLEPRRVATRAVASRMAATLHEPIGKRVGYRVRMENRCSEETIIEVMTEGVFLRKLQKDPELSDVALVIFDEFHERSQQSDLALALTKDTQEGLREDLRILIMSATLQGDYLSEKLNAPFLSCEGKVYPVETVYIPPLDHENVIATSVRAVKRCVQEQDGSILLFLPGAGEISRVAEMLSPWALDHGFIIAPLFGNLSLQEQDKAIQPPPKGQRKIVIATDIAETSLTIEGVTVVIDAGLVRIPYFDHGSGLTRLRTTKVSQASADQRQGRAGRIAPGTAYRLWSKESQSSLLAERAPEISSCDMAPLLLELALWGVTDPGELFWLNPPTEKAVEQGRRALKQLGAIDRNNTISERGSAMAKLGVHPRLAQLALVSKDETGCHMAALLSEGAILRPKNGHSETNLQFEIDLLSHFKKREKAQTYGLHLDKGILKRANTFSEQLQKRVSLTTQKGVINSLAEIAASGFSDRIAQRKSRESYLLANGKRVSLPENDSLKDSEFLIVLDAGGSGKNHRIFRALCIEKEEIYESCSSEIESTQRSFWDSETDSVRTVEQDTLGAITLSEHPCKVDDESATRLLCERIREKGLQILNWSAEASDLLARLQFLHHWDNSWPDFSEEMLLATLEKWLAPYLTSIRKASQFDTIDLKAALLAQFNWEKQQEIDRLAPTHFAVPEGSRVAINYCDPAQPVLAAKLQMMFGSKESPHIMNGQVPLQIHLLSPAGRPLQITMDLKSFWENSYEEVKKEMKGRYPKHPWPDNPMEAVATRKTKRALEREK